MASFEYLSRRIRNIDKKIEDLESIKKGLVQARQEVCPHEKIKQSGGDEWFDYYETPNHGRNPFILTCLDCGLTGNSRRYLNKEGDPNPAYEVYEKLSQLRGNRNL